MYFEMPLVLLGKIVGNLDKKVGNLYLAVSKPICAFKHSVKKVNNVV